LITSVPTASPSCFSDAVIMCYPPLLAAGAPRPRPGVDSMSACS
jgi:hypothetical protein